MTKESVHSITQTSDGSVWIGTRRGAGRFKDGRFEELSLKGSPGNEFIRDILRIGPERSGSRPTVAGCSDMQMDRLVTSAHRTGSRIIFSQESSTTITTASGFLPILALWSLLDPNL